MSDAVSLESPRLFEKSNTKGHFSSMRSTQACVSSRSMDCPRLEVESSSQFGGRGRDSTHSSKVDDGMAV